MEGEEVTPPLVEKELVGEAVGFALLLEDVCAVAVVFLPSSMALT